MSFGHGESAPLGNNCGHLSVDGYLADRVESAPFGNNCGHLSVDSYPAAGVLYSLSTKDNSKDDGDDENSFDVELRQISSV